MKKTIYISGSITNPDSGQPRDGWQKEFLEAEARLRAMGFSVINPVDIAQEVDDAFKWRYKYCGGPCNGHGEPLRPSRTDYIMACLQRMQLNHEADMLHGVYVIGDIKAARISHGVQMEIHLAELLGLPIYAEWCDGKRVNRNLIPLTGSAGIEELLTEG